MSFPYALIILLVEIIVVAVGLLLILKPDLAIELQKKFYEKINWRMEPISMPKEIRNTRIMGVFLILLSLLLIIFFFHKSYLNSPPGYYP
ncbi:MAG: hypothetical protein JW734_00690 [Candidatus Omnitrophica bacterium]|nr:hypothetical protein [Candidatus Omnitrophota bacterium]